MNKQLTQLYKLSTTPFGTEYVYEHGVEQTADGKYRAYTQFWTARSTKEDDKEFDTFSDAAARAAERAELHRQQEEKLWEKQREGDNKRAKNKEK